jgi:hypothetical protein
MNLSVPIYATEETQGFYKSILSQERPEVVLYQNKRVPFYKFESLLKKYPVLLYQRLLFGEDESLFAILSIVCLRTKDLFKVNVKYPQPEKYPMLRFMFAGLTESGGFHASLAEGTFTLNKNMVRGSDEESLSQ